MEVHIVKRKGHKEHFDQKKIYTSCFAACLNVHMHKEDAEKCASKATKDIKAWVKNKKEVTSNQIFTEVIKALGKHSPEAAFMYETHRDIA